MKEEDGEGRNSDGQMLHIWSEGRGGVLKQETYNVFMSKSRNNNNEGL